MSVNNERDSFLKTVAFIFYGDESADLSEAPAGLPQEEWDTFVASFSMSPEERRKRLKEMWDVYAHY